MPLSSLLPFGKRITLKSRLFVSWVGLRGAVPIIFATYPVVANVPGAHVIYEVLRHVLPHPAVAPGGAPDEHGEMCTFHTG